MLLKALGETGHAASSLRKETSEKLMLLISQSQSLSRPLTWSTGQSYV